MEWNFYSKYSLTFDYRKCNQVPFVLHPKSKKCPSDVYCHHIPQMIHINITVNKTQGIKLNNINNNITSKQFNSLVALKSIKLAKILYISEIFLLLENFRKPKAFLEWAPFNYIHWFLYFWNPKEKILFFFQKIVLKSINFRE